VHYPEADKRRDTWLGDRGILTMRFSAEDLNVEAMMESVKAACDRIVPKF
jgi:hypothetical protein